MKKSLTICFALIVCFSFQGFGQFIYENSSNSFNFLEKKEISKDTLIQIIKAEDELRFDRTLEDLLKSKDPQIRRRAALAAGRIGDERAVPALAVILNDSGNPSVAAMAAFALGEIESISGADAVLSALKDDKIQSSVRARAVEAAGKIAAANPKEEKSKTLGEAILDGLEMEDRRGSKQSKEFVLLGLTAALRAKPDEADYVVAKFLTNLDARIRADAANALARLRGKKANGKLRAMLLTDDAPIARANAARALGAAGDKDSVNILIEAAATDEDLRVRINAIRALGGLKSEKAADRLLERAGKLFAGYKKSEYENPSEENELLTITVALGNILKGTENERALKFLTEFLKAEKLESPEIEQAFAKISPKMFVNKRKIPLIDQDAENELEREIKRLTYKWRPLASWAQGAAVIADLPDDSDENKRLRKKTEENLRFVLNRKKLVEASVNVDAITLALPSVLSAFAKFKPAGLNGTLAEHLNHHDVIVRARAASLLGDVKPATPNQAAAIYKVLSRALHEAREDKLNDASLSILGAMKKQYENQPDPMPLKVAYMTPFISAIESPDYLIRRRAVEIYRGFDLKKPDPKTVGNPDFKLFEVPADFGIVKFPKTVKNGARSRVVRADYKRALSRKNGRSKAILKTEKGNITIEFFPEEAPLTVDNFIRLARAQYFNGLAIHRVVPNFVVQDGDSRGDGSGGPGWQIRCEINQIPYERGMVGMALSGKDTGGSQWFVTHSPQPHLDGGYTVFGRVNEKDMKIVDMLARGDKILSVKVVGR